MESFLVKETRINAGKDPKIKLCVNLFAKRKNTIPKAAFSYFKILCICVSKLKLTAPTKGYYKFTLVNYIGYHDKGMLLVVGYGDKNGKPQIDKTEHLSSAYQFGKEIYKD